MKNFELYYPARPFVTTQAWGIKNPSYEQFGFTHHNGVDFAVDADGVVLAPCEAEVIEVGFNAGAGNYVKLKTPEVICEGVPCFVILFFMHARNVLVKTGQKVVVGDTLFIADNTGFSTGPHTHLSTYRINKFLNQLDLDKKTNYTFDPAKYFNKKYAEYAILERIKQQLLKILDSLGKLRN